MPKPNGQLAQDELDKIVAWLTEKIPQPHLCPSCRHNNWDVGQFLIQPTTLGAGGNILLGGIGYPQVLLTCTNCGHTLMYNSVLMGLSKPSPPLTDAGGSSNG